MVVSLLAISVFIMGLNAIQKGEVAWSRTKTITGQPAKRIGVALIVLSVLLGLLTIGFSVMRDMQRDNYGLNPPATSTSSQP